MDKIRLYSKSFSRNTKNNIHIFVLILICCLSFFLNFYNISKYGYGNEYYAAAIKSMTQNFKNFFFVSFDPNGMVSVDKPPLGLWIQAIFVILFGYNIYSLILPQALCGTGCCILIYLILSNNRDKISGLISAFIFSIIPSVVVVSRNNTMDMQLIFIILISVFFFFKYLTSNKIKFLILASSLIGLGFNIKMLQAYIVLPAFIFTYFLFSKNKTALKLSRALIAFSIIIIISFSWIIAVDLYPSDSRPYIDNSKTNSALELAINYNGIDRLLGKDNNLSFSSNSSNNTTTIENSGDYIGSPSILRLWNPSLYGQISWLLVLALGSVLLALKRFKSENNHLKKADFIFWSLWLLTLFIVFSFSGFFHRYYLSMLAPPIAVLCGIQISWWIRDLKSMDKLNLFDVISSILILLITISLEIKYIYSYPQIRFIIISIVLLMFIISLIIIVSNIRAKDNFNVYISMIFLLCSLIISSLYWSLTTIMYVPNLTMPSAGPELSEDVTNTKSAFSSNSKNTSSGLQNYLVQNYKQGSFLVVSKRCVDVSKFIINTGLPAYAYGGFLGNTQNLTTDKLKQYVSENKITYFLISSEDINDKNSSDLIEYVKANGRLINPIDYGDFKSINKDSGSTLTSITNIGGGYGSSLYLLHND